MGLKGATDAKPLASEAKAPVNLPRPEAQYIHGVTVIDRSRACKYPLKPGEKKPLPSLLRGKPTCRTCYEGPPCDCGSTPHVSEVNVYWTSTSKYLSLGLASVRRCEDIAVAEAKRLGMSCIIIRKEQHKTFTQRTKTGKRTGRHLPADWHITIYLGDSVDELLLQGHTYVFMGKKNVPQCKLHSGQRTILEPHELMQKLTLKDAEPQTYWGINGTCGYA